MSSHAFLDHPKLSPFNVGACMRVYFDTRPFNPVSVL